MYEGFISRRVFLFSLLFSVVVCTSVALKFLFSTNTKIVFCDVGQADGVYIRTSDNIDIVIDAGSDGKILACLGKYMPFYDRTVELAFLTHSQLDHYGGFAGIFDRYSVEYFITSPVDNPNKSFNRLKEKIKASPDTIVKNLYQGETIQVGSNAEVAFLWPTLNFTDIYTTENTTGTDIGESSHVLGAVDTKEDLNSFSQIILYKQADFEVLFTGDAGPEILNREDLIDSLLQQGNINIEIMKVPHHGSKNGLTEDFLKLADPVLGVISVGKKNAFGHPHKEVTSLFEALNKEYLLTSSHGDIVIEVEKNGFTIF